MLVTKQKCIVIGTTSKNFSAMLAEPIKKVLSLFYYRGAQRGRIKKRG
jgi:hypothetical protein